MLNAPLDKLRDYTYVHDPLC